jgi:hypothetical protein
VNEEARPYEILRSLRLREVSVEVSGEMKSKD